MPGNGPGDDLRDCFGGIYVGLMILLVGFAGGFCWLISDNLGYFDITRIKGMWFPGNIQKTISHPEMIYYGDVYISLLEGTE